MKFTTLSFNKISILGLILAISLASIISHSLYKSSWQTLLSDKIKDPNVKISNLQVSKDFPASKNTINRILLGEKVEGVNIDVFNYWDTAILEDRGPKFSTQVNQKISTSENSYKNKKFVVFTDIKIQDLSNIDEPTLFFDRLSGDWNVYINNEKIGSGTTTSRYLTFKLPENITDNFRITWVIKNSL